MKNFDAGIVTSVKQKKGEGISFTLNQNYPNPFNPMTTINFSLPAGKKVALKIYDVLGREVSTLIDSYMGVGRHSVMFNGVGLPSGIYIYRLTVGSLMETRKMLLLK